ncbi:hypothetical protein ASPZODRAFT_27693 [Penicilliopsis zonata CBS 506.65]|uniref:Isochorismatase-like domain-containing protein n=1 Tax=Penicilliopsis zonata CBS 506.65 TaxID=1073090 RepID=A0A1L9SBB2_9EURO|nr:hypothetical protein ASPZODRAFT_27693 [Penicilliopsis zonata CBS 506.65]OJJ44454.1 hypothetical protein ASPZODRAFT_27693 [Penicilliopsis zonata CBS 506.65]
MAPPFHPLAVPAKKTALLILDLHKFIISHNPTGESVVLNAVKLRAWAKAQGMLVAHCLIDFKATTPENRKMAARFNGVRDEMGSAPDKSGEDERIAAIADEYVFWRPPSHISAMGSYGLKDWLAEHDIQSLVLVGLSSSGCVINTTKGAADAGWIVTVVEDACGDKSPEAHEVIMSKLLVGQANVFKTEEVERFTW